MSDKDQVMLGIGIVFMCIGFGMVTNWPDLGIVMIAAFFVIFVSVISLRRM